jgi:hypothetical protein
LLPTILSIKDGYVKKRKAFKPPPSSIQNSGPQQMRADNSLQVLSQATASTQIYTKKM